MTIAFAFDIVDGDDLIENDIRAYGLIPEAPFVKYVVRNGRFKSLFSVLRLADMSSLDRGEKTPLLYSFRFSVYPAHILRPATPDNDWFGESDLHQVFREKIRYLASLENLNLLIDHSWEQLPLLAVEDLIKIFARLGFPPSRLIIISSGRKLSESAQILQSYGTIVAGYWFWEAYFRSELGPLRNRTKRGAPPPMQGRVFLSLNRVPRPHRIALCAFLHSRSHEIAYYSFGGQEGLPSAQSDIAGLVNEAKYLLGDQSIVTHENIDALIGAGPKDLDVKFSATVQSPDLAVGRLTDIEPFYSSSKISILTETRFDDSLFDVFLTEKIFKTIAFGHGFIALSAPGTLFELRRLGYATFGEIIDESYDEILDPPRRLQKILCAIDKLWGEWLERGDKVFYPIRAAINHNLDNFLMKSDRRLIEFMKLLEEKIAERFLLPIRNITKKYWDNAGGSASMRLSEAKFVEFVGGFFGWELENFGRWMSSVGVVQIALPPGAWSFRLFLRTQGGLPIVLVDGDQVKVAWARDEATDVCSFECTSFGYSDVELSIYSRTVFSPTETGRSLDKRVLGLWWEDRIDLSYGELRS